MPLEIIRGESNLEMFQSVATTLPKILIIVVQSELLSSHTTIEV